MKTHEIDIDKLAVLLKERRGERGLRNIAKEIGNVSAPTLSRIEQGRVPDLDTFIRVCRWLDISPEHFLITPNTPVKEYKDTVVEKVEILLRAERTLPQDTIKAIMKMVSLAIEANNKEKQ